MFSLNPVNESNMKASFLAILAVAIILASFATANAQTSSGAQNGKKIFEKLGCFRCHGSAGEGMTGNGSGPPKIAATHLSLPEFVGSVRDPKGQMPPFSAKQVSDVELSDVYAFLQSIGSQPKLELPASANSDNGKRFYTSFGCYECHGLEGQGSVSTGGARLGPPQIPFSGFVAYARQPTGQMPPYTSKVVSDAQLADIYAFLRSLPQATPAKNIPLLNQ
jgi:mono/diheme cytochrome c family protein